MNTNDVDVVIAGATGLVGRTMIRVLEERSFPVARLFPMATARSAGQVLAFRDERCVVKELTAEALRTSGARLALFSAGATVSRIFAPIAVDAGMLVVDNSSAFRMEKGVPLVVPEVNPNSITPDRGIIANPNCSTIQMVVALKPLHDRFRIRRIVVSTYQSVTGAGQRGYDQLVQELDGKTPDRPKFPHPIAGNVIPQIDGFLEDGYTREERKMMDETRKILDAPSLRISATCVRVPVVGGHSEAITVEFDHPYTLEEVKSILEKAPGITVMDDPSSLRYPMPVMAKDRDDVLVGRLRRDPGAENSLNLWVVADNIRKGAATNAVQIAEEWLQRRAPI